MSEFCPKDCKYLNYTEEQQELELKKVHHKCLKYGQYLYHLSAHPELYKCEECRKDNIKIKDTKFI